MVKAGSCIPKRSVVQKINARCFAPMIPLKPPASLLLPHLCSGLLLGLGDLASATGAPPVEPAPVKWHPGHYVFVNRAPIHPGTHLSAHFRGVQKCYGWMDLEPEKGRYDFTPVEQDLALLQKHGKQLVLQLQFKAFGKGNRLAPGYLQGPEYGGGVYRASSGSFNPVIWNPAVGQRLDALMEALGRAFDQHPHLEAVVLPETAPSASLAKFPQPGVDPYTEQGYLEALQARMTALRRAFPGTVVIQYANYPPSLLDELTNWMKHAGIGLGGPDVYPRPHQYHDPDTGIYRLYPKLAGAVPLGAAVQSPDYSVAAKKRTAAFDRGMDPQSVRVEAEDEIPIPVREHLALARENLKLNYLFWSATPRACLESVKRLLAAPDLAGDPCGGLNGNLPAQAFVPQARP